MAKKRTYIVLLVLFQLTVFVTPLLIKGTHIHTFEHAKTHAEKGTTLSEAIAGCPIYKFEFITSDLQEAFQYSLFQQANNINNIEPDNQIFRLSFTSCQLRAPPVS